LAAAVCGAEFPDGREACRGWGSGDLFAAFPLRGPGFFAVVIMTVNLDGQFRAHVCADCAAGAFFRMFPDCREISAPVKISTQGDDTRGARFCAVSAALAVLAVYFYDTFHLSLPRSSSACFSEVSVVVPLSILAISSCRSPPSIGRTSTRTLLF